MNRKFDILGFGCAAVEELLYVEAYPRAEGKVRIQRRERRFGGITAGALVAAARLGGRCAFAGILGQDRESDLVLESLQREKIDISGVIRHADACPLQSTIVVEEGNKTRTVFLEINQAQGADLKGPAENLVRSSRVLLVDEFGIPGMIRAARIARAAGVAVVADFGSGDGPGFGTLLKLVDHLVLSQTFACKFTGTNNPAEAAAKLWNNQREVVIITCGAKGCLYLTSARGKSQIIPAFKVKAIDATGCGDVFRGAYAFALACNMDLTARISFATAAAALKATRPAGEAGIPTLDAVEKFLKRSG